MIDCMRKRNTNGEDVKSGHKQWPASTIIQMRHMSYSPQFLCALPRECVPLIIFDVLQKTQPSSGATKKYMTDFLPIDRGRRRWRRYGWQRVQQLQKKKYIVTRFFCIGHSIPIMVFVRVSMCFFACSLGRWWPSAGGCVCAPGAQLINHWKIENP